jgi:hypothetical protein
MQAQETPVTSAIAAPVTCTASKATDKAGIAASSEAEPGDGREGEHP